MVVVMTDTSKVTSTVPLENTISSILVILKKSDHRLTYEGFCFRKMFLKYERNEQPAFGEVGQMGGAGADCTAEVQSEPIQMRAVRFQEL